MVNSAKETVTDWIPCFPLRWEDSTKRSFLDTEKKDTILNHLSICLHSLVGTQYVQRIVSYGRIDTGFSLERVGKSGAKFDPEKTKWYNQQHLRLKSKETLVNEIKGTIDYNVSDNYLEGVIELMKERATFANELLSEKYLLSPLLNMMKKHLEKMEGNSSSIMDRLFERINLIKDFSTENIEHTFKAYITENELGWELCYLV